MKLALTLAATLAACGGVPQRTTDAPASSSSAGAIAPADMIQIGAGGSGSPSSGATTSSSAAPTGSSTQTPDTIVARHILIQFIGCKRADAKIVRTRDQALKVAEEVERRLKAGDDFAHLVVDFSDEPNASSRGGSLGRFGHGVMDKVFENAAFKLKPGEISPIIETSFGFHVIQRTD